MSTQQAILELIVKLKDEASAGLKGIAGNIASAAGPVALAGVIGVAGAIGGIGAASFDTAVQVENANALIQDALGLTASEAEALGATATDVFANNFGGSIEEAAQGLVAVRQNMQGLDPSQLQGATEAAFNLQSAFGVDLAESTNAANTLMSNFGLTSQQAFDFLAQGFTNGLDTSGDFLDTIGEYSNQFANGGADASQFFSLMESGLQGGVLGTDKAADAFKEFRLRILDGSDATATALGQIGLDTNTILAGLSDGSITAADAFGLVTEALAKTEDPALRLQAGAALIGTQFEDLGDTAVANIDLATTSLEDMAGASAEAGNQGETFSSRFEAAQRRLQVALLPVGQELLKVAEQYLPYVEQALERLVPWIAENLPRAIEGLMRWWTDLNEGIEVVRGALGYIQSEVQGVIDAFGRFWDQLTGLGDALPDWLTPGSPTPLELGLDGINRAMGELAGSELPALESSLDLSAPTLPAAAFPAGAGPGGGGGGITVQVTVQGTVTSERDLIEAIRSGLIEVGRQNVTTGIP
jgi:TP901 family phage tail tape measure protein